MDRATVHLPNGTTLDYEPINYEGSNYPAPPAGAQTGVLGFRLAKVTDRNGYKTCLRYRVPQGSDRIEAQRNRGAVASLEEVAYGLPPSAAATCADIFASADRHSIRFEYQLLSDANFYATWTLRFGAPVSFDDLLTRIVITPRRAQRPQDEFILPYYPSDTNDTRRPLLKEIRQQVPVSGAYASNLTSGSNLTSTRIVRSFAYGKRDTQFSQSEVIDIGAPNSVPESLAGCVSRPVRRASLLQNPNGIFQTGQDQDSDAAPITHATTEQWAFLDSNGDGLPDLQWGRESGFAKDAAGNDAPWATFEAAPPPFSGEVHLFRPTGAAKNFDQ